MEFDLMGQRVFVTGAAGGMGAAIAGALLSAGASVALADVDGERLTQVARDLGDAGRDALLCPGDVRDRDAVAGWLAQVQSAWGVAPGGLVNCVGVFDVTPTATVGPDEWERTIGINLTGVFNTCQVFGTSMVEAKRGSIVNIGSIAGLRGREDRAAYVASKHGVHGLTKTLATEWGGDGVRVNCVAPGRIETSMAADSFAAIERSKAWLARTPMGRFGAPEEVAGPVLFLLSDMSSYITGQELAIDGGYVCTF